MSEPLLTIEQAATHLQIHPESVRRLLRGGQLKGIKIGRLWRVPLSAISPSTENTELPRTAPN